MHTIIANDKFIFSCTWETKVAMYWQEVSFGKLPISTLANPRFVSIALCIF